MSLVSIIGLVIGLFVPKFIGLEAILTMQLIFYSQMLIVDNEKWPLGFVIQFKYLKTATGYNEMIELTSYLALSNFDKKYDKLSIHKTIIENFNINFCIVLFVALLFYLAVFLRSRK